LLSARPQSILRSNVDVLLAVADALAEKGELYGDEVDQIIVEAVARRAAAIEKQRRADWRRRTANAATFQAERLR